MSGLLSIPCSNADAERGFSVLRKVHTDQRASLSQSTIINLLRVKMNNTDCCFDTTISDELITNAKKLQPLSKTNQNNNSHCHHNYIHSINYRKDVVN